MTDPNTALEDAIAQAWDYIPDDTSDAEWDSIHAQEAQHEAEHGDE